MADYNQTTDFAVKDTLPKGDPQKVVRGKEIHDEFRAIEDMSKTKVDKPAGGTGKIAVVGPVPGGFSFVPGTLYESQIVDKTSAQTVSGKSINGSTWNGGTITGATINDPTFGGTVTLVSPQINGAITFDDAAADSVRAVAGGVWWVLDMTLSSDVVWNPGAAGTEYTVPFDIIERSTQSDTRGNGNIASVPRVNRGGNQTAPKVTPNTKYVEIDINILAYSSANAHWGVKIYIGDTEVWFTRLTNRPRQVTKKIILDVSAHEGEAITVRTYDEYDATSDTIDVSSYFRVTGHG